MKLDKGSKLARQESREKRKMRSSALQDLLDEEVRERELILQAKAEREEALEREVKRKRSEQRKSLR